MRKFYAVSVMTVILSLPTMAAVDLSGGWTLKLAQFDGSEGPTIAVTFKQDGQKLVGSCLVIENNEEFTVAGELTGDMVVWQCNSPRYGDAAFSASLTGTGLEMSGSWNTPTSPGKGTFTAKKQ